MIRKITPNDVGRLAEIIVYNNRKYYYPIFNDIMYSFNEFTVENVTKFFSQDKEFMENCFVYDDTVIKGFVYVLGDEIRKLYVDVFFQGQGVGKALLEYAVKEYNANTLWALEKNENAIKFYEKNGFHRTFEKRYEEGTTEFLVRLLRQL